VTYATIVEHDPSVRASSSVMRSCATHLRRHHESARPVGWSGEHRDADYLAETAREVADKYGLEITVWGKDELRTRGMNAILAVNAGSAQHQPSWR